MEDLGSKLVFDVLKTTMRCGMFVSVFYLGATYHNAFSRLERNILYKNLSVEQGYFQDPEGLELVVRMNERGNLVPCIFHKPSGLSLPISNDIIEHYGVVK
ncbi:hypothetical protein HY483_01195 [Candidatus Woesearchaeota archaeon]|nr:hypothetical protein [Candidatus Woesearchaeota archaeon]